MQVLTELIKGLKKSGFRLTRARKQILEIIYASVAPLSIVDIIAELSARNLPVNKTTVYREVTFLQNQNVVEGIDLGDGKMRYELRHDGSHHHHHHHLVCLKCRKVECIHFDNCLVEEQRKVSELWNFKIINHSLNFFGFCCACSDR
ncbi:MAG: transcriptional repressor [Nitrospirae bacterium YQR-1]